MLPLVLLLTAAFADAPAPDAPAPPAPPAAPEAAPAAAPAPPPPLPKKLVASALLDPRSGSAVKGKVAFLQKGAEIKVVIDLTGATPGEHAVHIHEHGDCSAADATSAGSHFNPEHHEHGDATAPMHHPGDFGNVRVGEDGHGHKELTLSSFTLLAGQPLSVAGLAVIVHEKPDDFSQPVGNAGARQACGVIKVRTR